MAKSKKAQAEPEAVAGELRRVRQEYHDSADSLTAPELRAMSDRIKSLATELGAALAPGAKACETCGSAAIGMEKSSIPVRAGEDSIDVKIYAVGCPACPSTFRGEGPDRVEVKSYAAGGTPEKAAEAWNGDKRVIRPAPEPAE